MKTVGGILFGVGMALLWSGVFVSLLDSWAGIGIGILFGISFGSSMTVAFNSSKNKEKPENMETNEQ